MNSLLKGNLRYATLASLWTLLSCILLGLLTFVVLVLSTRNQVFFMSACTGLAAISTLSLVLLILSILVLFAYLICFYFTKRSYLRFLYSLIGILLASSIIFIVSLGMCWVSLIVLGSTGGLS